MNSSFPSPIKENTSNENVSSTSSPSEREKISHSPMGIEQVFHEGDALLSSKTSPLSDAPSSMLDLPSDTALLEQREQTKEEIRK